MTIRTVGRLVAVLVAVAAVAMIGVGTASAAGRYARTYQGHDKASYDTYQEDFDVCDKEKDGRPVYAYFSNEDDHYYYDRTGAGGRCKKFKRSASHQDHNHLGIMYVCEEIRYWKDACSNGVTLYTGD